MWICATAAFSVCVSVYAVAAGEDALTRKKQESKR